MRILFFWIKPRTTISELHEAMVISEDTLKTFAGHKDISTTQKCYIHQTKDITEYAEEFAKYSILKQ